MNRSIIPISKWLMVFAGLFAILVTIRLLHNTYSKPTPKVIGKPYSGPYAAAGNDSEHGFLPTQEAEDFCARRRWDVYSTRDKRRKVYDMFLISTELDWLDIRLQELDSVVDFFIIMESDTTFQGGPKPLYLKDNYEQFSKFHDKIIYKGVDLSGTNFPEDDIWAPEHFQRNALLNQALLSLTSDAQKPEQGDVLLVSDVDEIPRPSTIQALRNCAFPPRVTLRTLFFYYSYQWLHRGLQWHHPQATYFNGSEGTVQPENLRTQGEPDVELYNAGWHCSSCYPTMDDMKKKITSFSHSNFNQPYFLDEQRLLRHVRMGEDLFEREGEVFDRWDDNAEVPFVLRGGEMREKYSYLLDRDPPNGNFKDM